MLLETGVALNDFYWVISLNTLPSTPDIVSTARSSPLFPPETTDVVRRFVIMDQVGRGGDDEEDHDRMWPFGHEPVDMNELESL